jgi:hypothetical protein
MRSHEGWQWFANPHLHVGGRVLRGLAAEGAVHTLFLLLREIESPLDTFRRPLLGRGRRNLPAGRLRQHRPRGAEHCDSSDGNEMSHWIRSFTLEPS